MAVTVVTHACRATIVAVAAWVLVDRSRSLNVALQWTWDAMRTHTWVQHDTFEPSLVVIVFALSIGFFFMLDVPLGGFTSGLHTETCANGDMRAWAWEGGKHLLQETAFYVLPLAAFDLLFPRRMLPMAAPSAGRLVTEVLLGLLLYDLFFTAGHMVCHHTPWLYLATHAKHHRMKTIRACETICLTFWEEALDVGCSILALNLTKAHPMSRALYNIVIVYLLTELHSGYEFPWMLQDVVPLGLWAGSRAHAQHHRDGNMCFQKFFTYIDAAMGTLPQSKAAGTQGRSAAGTVAHNHKSG